MFHSLMIIFGLMFCILCHRKRKTFHPTHVLNDFLRGAVFFSGLASIFFSFSLFENTMSEYSFLKLPLALGGVASFSLSYDYYLRVEEIEKIEDDKITK